MFPDLHGRDFWKKALANSCEWTANRLIFLGDYFDPYPSEGIAPTDAIRNWWELQLTLRQHPDKEVVFLMGNHDAHYVSATFRRLAQGNRFSARWRATISVLLSSVDLQIAHETRINGKRILFTHAGLTYPWYLAHRNIIGELSADNLNGLTKREEGWEALADISAFRNGYEAYGSVLWADRGEFTHDALEGVPFDRQIVGHNQFSGNEALTLGTVSIIDCHHPFALTADLQLVRI